MRPSTLYRNLGITDGEAFVITGDAGSFSTVTESVSIARGNGDISAAVSSTMTLDIAQHVPLAGDRKIAVSIAPNLLAAIAAKTGKPETDLRDRFIGRIATQSASDTHRRIKRSTLQAVSWTASLTRVNRTYQTDAHWLSGGPLDRWLSGPDVPSDLVTWAGTSERILTRGDTWKVADWLSLLEDRGYVISDQRDGHIIVRALDDMETRAEAAAINTWPLARAHVISPTSWEQTSEGMTEYALTYVDAEGTTRERYISADGSPSGTARVETLDWTDTQQLGEQWRRVFGYRRESHQTLWRLPHIDVRIDHLLASPYVGHRRAAGMLLALEIGDFVPLAGDWPWQIEGLHICVSLDETITPAGWSMRIGLAPYGHLAGMKSPPVKPRTWDQAGSLTWDQATGTWNSYKE